MIKFRWYYDTDKETEWLNEMAKQGYAMTKYFAGFYVFEECTPGEYVYQIDFSDNAFSVSKNYRDFMEETGVEIVQTWGLGWIFLRKKAADGEFVLYTDVDSRIEHYTKIRTMFKVAIIIELICFLTEIFVVMFGGHSGFLVVAFFIVLVVVPMLHEAIRTTQIINELKERKDEVVQCPSHFRNPTAPILVSGLMLNTCAMAMDNPDYHAVKIIVQIVAIVLMVVGLYRTASGWNEK